MAAGPGRPTNVGWRAGVGLLRLVTSRLLVKNETLGSKDRPGDCRFRQKQEAYVQWTREAVTFEPQQSGHNNRAVIFRP